MSVQFATISLTIVQAAQVTGLSKRYIAELISRGDLPSVKVGSRRLIMAEDIHNFLRERRTTDA